MTPTENNEKRLRSFNTKKVVGQVLKYIFLLAFFYALSPIVSHAFSGEVSELFVLIFLLMAIWVSIESIGAGISQVTLILIDILPHIQSTMTNCPSQETEAGFDNRLEIARKMAVSHLHEELWQNEGGSSTPELDHIIENIAKLSFYIGARQKFSVKSGEVTLLEK